MARHCASFKLAQPGLHASGATGGGVMRQAGFAEGCAGARVLADAPPAVRVFLAGLLPHATAGSARAGPGAAAGHVTLVTDRTARVGAAAVRGERVREDALPTLALADQVGVARRAVAVVLTGVPGRTPVGSASEPPAASATGAPRVLHGIPVNPVTTATTTTPNHFTQPRIRIATGATGPGSRRGRGQG
jgi:hypothetical protein